MGFGPCAESSHDKKGKRGQKISSPILLGRTYLRGRPRRSASSDTPDGSPTYTLHTVRNHPEREENARRPGGNHSCRIKCKGVTFSAALMWRRQANSVTLASATHRRIREMPDGTGTQVKVQMANKCKVLINSRRLYKRRKSPRRGDRRIKKKSERERLKNSIVGKQSKRCTYTSPRTDILLNVNGIFSRSTYCMAYI